MRKVVLYTVGLFSIPVLSICACLSTGWVCKVLWFLSGVAAGLVLVIRKCSITAGTRIWLRALYVVATGILVVGMFLQGISIATHKFMVLAPMVLFASVVANVVALHFSRKEAEARAEGKEV